VSRATGFRRRVRLGPGTEFDLIGSFLDGGGDLPPEVVVGPGDDCAVLEGGRWAVSCDLSLEGVHFRRDWLTLREIGYRAAAVALSDLAAVAATPVATLVSYGLTSDDLGADAARELHHGVEEACGEVGAVVVGGDLTRSPTILVVDVVVLGRADAPVLRDGARVGDEVWVTGGLGAAGAALRVLLHGNAPEPALRAAYAHPSPRVREALWLAERESLHALIDLSDGLGADAGHLAAASGVGIVLEAARLPVAPGTARVAGGERDAVELALSAGDDYELCMAAAPGALEELRDEFGSTFSLPLTLVGRVVEGRGVYLDSGDGEPVPLHDAGYDHVTGPGDAGA
jgi:thiamine-monophosphate kinase